ncbi:hypothetical protein [Pyxidicoccus parkwayensis]|uniref:hypothetical protein n=1 Tax=Pyxidicoccus parkwayensis TaxID=2813578 RepID=UPI001F50951C|nr:hypothetical protein [Pyxidicoccus parkwaysis]
MRLPLLEQPRALRRRTPLRMEVLLRLAPLWLLQRRQPLPSPCRLPRHQQRLPWVLLSPGPLRLRLPAAPLSLRPLKQGLPLARPIQGLPVR